MIIHNNKTDRNPHYRRN